jgi:hypothetical protein
MRRSYSAGWHAWQRAWNTPGTIQRAHDPIRPGLGRARPGEPAVHRTDAA